MIASLLLALGLAATDEPRLPPAAHCLDAREVSSAYQPDDSTLVVASGDRHYRLALAGSCPALLAQADALQLRAPGGWVCGGPQETVVGAGVRCPVAAVETIGARDYALAARRSDREVRTMETVQVTARAGIDRSRRFARGFAGTPDYCMDPRQMRGWTETPAGLQVEVSPRRNAGNRFYVVETLGSCPMLSGDARVGFRSGMGLGVVCGNAGDAIYALRDAFVAEVPHLDVDGSMLAVPAAGDQVAEVITGRCSIAAVYPVAR